jgi:putative PIN family toxin of toxin-antitoxin system
MTPRVVLDCVVCLQGAAREAGPAGACFRLMKEGRIAVCVSPATLAEVSDVLSRPKSRQRFKTLTPDRVEAFLRELRATATLLDPVPHVFTYPRDPDDEPYVDLAAAAGANYLVSWDKDLLDLMSEASPEGQDFRQRFPNLAILTPPDFLRAIRQEAPGETTDEGPTPSPTA